MMKSNSKINYIKRRESQKKFFTVKSVQVVVKDDLPSGLSIRNVITSSLSKVPEFLLKNLDIIYVGQFEELLDRDLHAIYKDASIFATNDHDSEESMIDDIVHEVAHSVEETYSDLIYSDSKIEKEFIQKRKRLWSILQDEGFEVSLINFINPEYDKNFDEFLYQEVGYPSLTASTVNLFYSPYAATSLREYFANGFEAFFMKEEIPRLKRISPRLFEKLELLLSIGDRADKQGDY